LDTLQITDAELRVIWNEHKAELMAEAQQAGFRPVAAGWFNSDEDIDDVPSDPDPKRDEWSKQFCVKHAY
jgi:hypothetical protein